MPGPCGNVASGRRQRDVQTVGHVALPLHHDGGPAVVDIVLMSAQRVLSCQKYHDPKQIFGVTGMVFAKLASLREAQPAQLQFRTESNPDGYEEL